MSDKITITKIKCKDEKITIHYEQSRDDREDKDKFTLESFDRAKAEFYQHLELLKSSVIEICELPAYFLDRIRVIGVSFSWTDDIMGATITALIKLNHSNAPLVINTPHKPETAYSESGDDSNVLPVNAIQDLSNLLRVAQAYIDGERDRKQLDMFDMVGTRESETVRV